jgi:hypothetical protein
MIAGYRIFLKLPDGRVMNYHGITYGDGVTPDSRVHDELSGRKRVNVRFAAAIEEHTQYAFDYEITGYFNSLHEAIEDEAARIARDDSTHPDKGFNVEKKDLKRAKKALAEYTPGASDEDMFAAGLVEFAGNNEEWRLYDTPENRAILFEIAKKNQRCSPATAFAIALETGALALNESP